MSGTLILSSILSLTPIPGVTDIGGSIWDGNQGPLLAGETYHVVADLDVPAGAVLTVEPGAIVKFLPSRALVVDGRLLVNLNRQQAPVFTSIFDDSAGGDSNGDGGATTPTRGDWDGVILASPSEPSTLRRAELRYGGNAQAHQITLANSPGAGHELDDLLVQESSSDGIALGGQLDVSVTDCHIEHCNGSALSQADPDCFKRLWNNTASDCGEILVDMPDWDSQFDESADLQRENLLQGVLPGPFRIADGTRLTLREGIVVKCLANSSPIRADGELFCHGTAAEPVVFTSLYDDAAGGDHNQDGGATSPAPGDWNGLRMGATTGDCVLQHVQVRYSLSRHVRAGGASLLMQDCLLEKGGDDGLELSGAGLQATVQRCDIRDNAGIAIVRAQWHHLPNFSELTATGNAQGDYVQVEGGSLSSDLSVECRNLIGDTLVLGAGISISAGEKIRLGPGVILKTDVGGAVLDVKDGVLDLDGRAGRPVVLTSLHDDSVGGDTEKDGNATAPAPGDWGRIRYQTYPAAPPSVVRFTALRYGGDSAPMFDLTGDRDLRIEQLRCSWSGSVGARIAKARYPACNLVAEHGNADGIEVQDSVLCGSTSYGNAGAGIDYRISTAGVSVRDCIAWANTGPNFGSLSATEVSFSDGGFAGQNGNLDVDPRFVDAAGGDYRLQAGSPCIDAATPGAVPIGADAGGLPRLLDGDLDRNLHLDMGAHEHGLATLSVIGAPVAGGTVTISSLGPSGWRAWLFIGIGTGDGSVILNHYGNLFLDFGAPWFLYRWASMPSSIDAALPPDLPPGFQLTLQELGVGSGAGMLTNPWVLTVEQ